MANKKACLFYFSFPVGCVLMLRALAGSTEGGPQLSVLQGLHPGGRKSCEQAWTQAEGVLAHTEDRADVHVRFWLPLLEDSVLQPSYV